MKLINIILKERGKTHKNIACDCMNRKQIRETVKSATVTYCSSYSRWSSLNVHSPQSHYEFSLHKRETGHSESLGNFPNVLAGIIEI